jgi:hypothetical protein
MKLFIDRLFTDALRVIVLVLVLAPAFFPGFRLIFEDEGEDEDEPRLESVNNP